MFTWARWILLAALSSIATIAMASTDGSISGTVYDNQGVAVSQAPVKLLGGTGNVVKETTTSITGEFQFFPVTFGDYQVSVTAPHFAAYNSTVHVASGGNTQVEMKLSKEAKEMVLNVEAKKHVVTTSSAVSSVEVTKEDIAKLPQGESVKLPKLLATTSPGIIQGPFGQTFIRGNHANIQYQIDGVQLPDSPSNTFGEAFAPRNIDHMEVITGGVPAEYGERLAAVVNVVTKTGTETPGGELELNYGSYNTTSPFALYSGSNSGGDVHYFLSAGGFRTDRGLDTPQPKGPNSNDVTQGGTEAVHDMAWGHSQFAKIDWLADNSNKISFVVFNSFNFYQIPNFPSSFQPTDPIFNQPDQFGNDPLNYVPSSTDDNQTEINSYGEIVWKHTLSDHAFLQLAPYYKYSYINVKNDPANDLAGTGQTSFKETRPVNNYGLKADYTDRLSEDHLLKAGIQVQGSQSGGAITVISTSGGPAVTSTDDSPTTGYFESIYAQDDYRLTKSLVLNLGLRFDVTQYSFGTSPSTYSADSQLQPRIGINYFLTDSTKIHVFYGKLFQPAPVENLRDTFITVGGGSALTPYDIKAEKDDYYEAGIAQQWGDQVFMLNAYYKDATNMLDDTQLLNTSIAQPYNFAKGFAYGTEIGVKGKISSKWSDYANYSYEIAKGNGIGGGLFTGVTPSNDWQYLDHVQIQTGNLGVTYKESPWWWTTQALYGSGLRTGANNAQNLPEHLTFDTSVGYEFTGESWWEKFKLSADILNIGNNVYPITIANGFNGSHYAAGRQYFVHLIKEL